MKFEVPTRSTRSQSNFWNPTNPQISDLPPCRTSTLPPTDHTFAVWTHLLWDPTPPTSLKPRSNSLKLIHRVLCPSSKVEHCYSKTRPYWRGADEITNTHTHTYITCYVVREIRWYRFVLLSSRLTFSVLHILCVAVVLFLLQKHLTFSLKNKLPPLHPAVSSLSCENKVFPVTSLCIPG